MKKTHFASALVLAALSTGLSAATLVTVNGTKIDSKEIDAQIKQITQQTQGKVQDSPELRNELIQDRITSVLVAQEAKRLKIDQIPEFKKALEQSRAQAKKQGADKRPTFKQEWAEYESAMLNRAYITHVLMQNPLSEADLKNAYKDFNQFYKGSQEVQLGEIFTQSAEKAQQAVNDLKAKKDFKSVARQYSVDPEVQKTGGINQGYIRLKDLEQGAPEVYNAVRNLKKGSFTETPMREEPNLFGVFYIHDKREVKVPPYEQIKDNLAEQIQGAKINEAIGALYQKATIQPAK
ncbi:peptidylprolyl isomerase [Neisseria weaveri]|uniref:peptidylprolyl isomerase n=1 Tax=Neisseria weaveri TaxID=28091 RepID=UPI0007C9D6EF|nr:peptidylprolyl isomerase [Neisseria weaveri]SAY51350.1 Cell-binding factor, putative [Neisseria weaveri]